MTRRAALAVALALALGVAEPVGAQGVDGASADGRFRFEWDITTSGKGPRLDAYVYNLQLRPVQNVQVLIEQLDHAGNAVHRSTTQVWAGVPAGGRTFFQVRGLMPSVRYRLSVVRFDLQPSGGGG